MSLTALGGQKRILGGTKSERLLGQKAEIFLRRGIAHSRSAAIVAQEREALMIKILQFSFDTEVTNIDGKCRIQESRSWIPGFWKTIRFQLHDYIKESFITLLLKTWLSSKCCCRSSPNTADFDCWRLPLQSWFLWSDQMGQKQSLEHRLAIVCRMQMIPRLALSPWSGGEWGWSFVCSETYMLGLIITYEWEYDITIHLRELVSPQKIKMHQNPNVHNPSGS